MPLIVAIIGRPNVGKSTLFNRLTGKKTALVSKMPGMTRDRREGLAMLDDVEFTLYDTAGLEQAEVHTLEVSMMAQTEIAVDAADVVLMVIDGKDGVVPMDQHFSEWLRRKGKPSILVVNKSDSRKTKDSALESYELGLGEPVVISAEHNRGMHALHEALLPFAEKPEEVITEGDEAIEEDGGEEEDEEEDEEPTLRVAIVGRPNAGKSTLFNHMVGEGRSIVGPQAGITRDSIETEWEYNGRPVFLVDTAGIRRRAKIHDSVEKLSVGDSIQAIQYAQIVILLLDATMGIDKQDLSLADHVIEEGRILLIVANKWDKVKNKDSKMEEINDRLEKSLPQARGIPVTPISALKGKHVDKLMKSALVLYETWNKRISTGKLNKWLDRALERHPPPLVGNRRIKLRYMAQIKMRPPTFAIFTSSKVQELPESYTRYLANDLRETFDFQGVPLRVYIRKNTNPYSS